MAKQLEDIVSCDLDFMLCISLTKRCNQLPNWPPSREKSQKTAVCGGQEFEQEGTIDGQVASNAETNACVQSTSSDPVGCGTCSNTEDTSDEESAVESETATDNVRHDAPEGGAKAETEEERESGVSDLVRIHAKLFGHGRERQCDTLKPEARATVSGLKRN
jgi:hypothetical protein